MVYIKAVHKSVHKLAGTERIHPQLLKSLTPFLAGLLVSPFDKTLVIGVMPSDLKTVIVILIHKKVSKRDYNNYRSVSLASIACKIMESLVRDNILLHLIHHNSWMGSVHLGKPLNESMNWGGIFTYANGLQWGTPRLCPRCPADPYLHKWCACVHRVDVLFVRRLCKRFQNGTTLMENVLRWRRQFKLVCGNLDEEPKRYVEKTCLRPNVCSCIWYARRDAGVTPRSNRVFKVGIHSLDSGIS